MDTGMKEKLFERCYQLFRQEEYSKESSDSNRLCQSVISCIIDRNIYESHLSTLACLGLLGEYEEWASKRSSGE